VLVPPLLELVAADVLDPPELLELLELDLLEPQPAATRATTPTSRASQYRPLLFALTVDMPFLPPLPRARPRCRQLIG
jgi:hypothetical protein